MDIYRCIVQIGALVYRDAHTDMCAFMKYNNHLPCLYRRDLYQKVNNFVLLNLCIALICGLITFCAGIETAAWHVVRLYILAYHTVLCSIHMYACIIVLHFMYKISIKLCKPASVGHLRSSLMLEMR